VKLLWMANDTRSPASTEEVSWSGSVHRAALSVTFFDVPPHVFYDASTKTVSGAVIDLLNYLAPAWDVQLIWDTEPSNIPREMEQLQKGEKDASYAPDHAAFLYEIKKAKAENSLRLVYTPEQQVPFHIGFS
jgi:hypothetical protein